MCLSHGHTPDASIVAAVTEQLETLPYAYPGISQTPVTTVIKFDLCNGESYAPCPPPFRSENISLVKK